MKILRVLLILAAIVIIIYLLGPNPDEPQYSAGLPAVPADASALSKYVDQKESRHRLKPNNQARIIWHNDSSRNKTEYVLVYLHGFSASQAEGEPVHRNFAKKFGCNLYLSRLAEHGLDTAESLANFTTEKLWHSAKEAIAIGKQLGEKVIIAGTSTGGTIGLMLAAQNPEISALILMSPNIAINDGNAWMLNNPWGLQIARIVKRSKYIESSDTRPEYKQYWSTPYRIEAAVELEELLETAMNKETFAKIEQPVLMLYYFKDEQHQDDVVKVSAMKEMFEQLGTDSALKRAIPIPGAGDHVIGSYLKSKDLNTVQHQIEVFAQDILKMQIPETIPETTKK